MAGEAFQKLDLTRVARAMARVHEQVAQHDGRVEITREDCDDVCVLISRAELESLERAMEILANTDDFRAMCEQVNEIAASSWHGFATRADGAKDQETLNPA